MRKILFFISILLICFSTTSFSSQHEDYKKNIQRLSQPLSWKLITYKMGKETEMKAFTEEQRVDFITVVLRGLQHPMGQRVTDKLQKKYPELTIDQLQLGVSAIYALDNYADDDLKMYKSIVKTSGQQKNIEKLTQTEQEIFRNWFYHQNKFPPETFPGIDFEKLETARFEETEKARAAMGRQKVNLVITASEKNYANALAKAKDASKKLGYPLNLRGLTLMKEGGLTSPKTECVDIGFPCYYYRAGERALGQSVSIEDSTHITGFTKGYYVVIIDDSTTSKESLALAKKMGFEDAYVKSHVVYVGSAISCGH